jgi:hypothetical protein|tara:strand:- start:487 stop:687 length:201 start_codon:yes stop_codon:yes gene_type:complete
MSVRENRRHGDPRYTRYISWLHWHYSKGNDVSKLNYEEFERRNRERSRNKAAAARKKKKADEWLQE